MRQLTSLDAQFLGIEDSQQTGHVGSLGIYDPSTAPGGELTAARMEQLVRDRLDLLPPLRWRLMEVPFGLDYPYWVEDEHFDLEFHVREIALPRPGHDRQLADQVARLHARPLDRARPLWEMYLISGLESGYVAVYTKIHHAVVDGVSGAEIVGVLLDLSPEARPVHRAKAGSAGPPPGRGGLLARALLAVPRYPARAVRSLPRALPHLDESSFHALPAIAPIGRLAGRAQARLSGDHSRVVRPTVAAPKTRFNGRVSPHRRFAFGSFDLGRVKAVKDAHGVTVNDVVVTLCAAAVRRWLVEHHDLPDRPLVAQVPVSVRKDDQLGSYGNRIVLLAAPLHTEYADPVERLRRTAEDLRVMKERHRAIPAELLSDVNNFIPPALFSRAARLTFGYSTSVGRPTWNLVVSNVPGPQQNLYCAGARLVANYPLSVITHGMGLNITCMSYAGHLDFGIVSDRDQMPDVWCLVEWLEEALTELEATFPK